MENLDAMTPDELTALAATTPDYREYALTKARAIACREAGEIPEALLLERLCDWLYAKLPKNLRW